MQACCNQIINVNEVQFDFLNIKIKIWQSYIACISGHCFTYITVNMLSCKQLSFTKILLQTLKKIRNQLRGGKVC